MQKKRADEAFQFADSGKKAVANAVTAKGVSASPTDAFSVLAGKIGQISTGKKYFSKTLYKNEFITYIRSDSYTNTFGNMYHYYNIVLNLSTISFYSSFVIIENWNKYCPTDAICIINKSETSNPIDRNNNNTIKQLNSLCMLTQISFPDSKKIPSISSVTFQSMNKIILSGTTSTGKGAISLLYYDNTSKKYYDTTPIVANEKQIINVHVFE